MPSSLYPDLPNSDFPDRVDQFTDFLNILASDGGDVKAYQEAIKDGNFTLANQILERIPDYNQKVLTAKDLNKFAEALQSLERFYATDIVGYVDDEQVKWQATVDDFKYAKPFNYSTVYVKNNYVTYGVGTSKYLYIALSDPPQGTLPTNTKYWRQLSVQGATGGMGDAVKFIGGWDATYNYVLANAVEYNGILWETLQPNTNQEPIDGSAYWKVVYRIPPAGFPVSEDIPLKSENGSLWFKIV